MPFFRSPTSDNGRLAFLKTTLDAARADAAAGNTYVTSDTVADIAKLVPKYDDRQKKVSVTLSARSKEFEESSTAITTVEMYLRDGFDVLKRMVRRLELPAQVLSLHGLPLDGTIPKPASTVEWLEIAQQFVDGSAKAKEQGYPVVDCPSAVDIDKVLVDAKKEYKDVSSADREYDTAQAVLAEFRTQSDDLINLVMAELRLTLRKLDAPSQRRIMRTYGANFYYPKGEVVDPDDMEPIADEVTSDTVSE